MRTAAAILSFVLAITILPAQSATAAVSTSPLPGGRTTFVVSQGHLKAASQQNWVRLGNYRFAANGTVKAALYLWSGGGLWRRRDAGCRT